MSIYVTNKDQRCCGLTHNGCKCWTSSQRPPKTKLYIYLASSFKCIFVWKRAVLASANNLLSILREISLKRENWTLLSLDSRVLGGFFLNYFLFILFSVMCFYLASSNWLELHSCQKDNDCVLKLICTNKTQSLVNASGVGPPLLTMQKKSYQNKSSLSLSCDLCNICFITGPCLVVLCFKAHWSDAD